MKHYFITLLATFCLCSSLVAQDFITPTAVSASTQDTDLWPVSNLIQGPGVGYNAEAPHESIVEGADGLWVTADDAGFPSDYVEEVGQPVVTFDLGSDTELGSISVWGYSSTNTNGASEFSLSIA